MGKKKPLPARAKPMTCQARLASYPHHLSKFLSQHHLTDFSPQKTLGWYKKYYGVNRLCAIRELKILGVDIDPEYERQIGITEEQRIQARQAKRKAREILQEPGFDDEIPF